MTKAKTTATTSVAPTPEEVTQQRVKETVQSKGDKRIVALNERWVFIGNYHEANGAGGKAYLSDAACIRAWGTTAGLGEIALNGPTPTTVLDPCGILVIDNPSAVIFTLKCSFAG